jgi:hypothetical protein
MKRLLLFFVLLIAIQVKATDIRSDFHKGMFQEDRLEDISESNSYPNTSLVNAYKGVCKTMLADYMYMPTSKLSYFNDGKADIEKAIGAQPKNPELRYLRLLVQLNAPFFLGYNDEIDTDINFFTQHLSAYKLSKYWKLKFIENIVGTEELTSSQKMKINTLKTNLNG